MTFEETANRTFPNYDAQLSNARAVRKRLRGHIPVRVMIIPPAPIAPVEAVIEAPLRDILYLASEVYTEPPQITIRQIKMAVSEVTKVSIQDIEGQYRPRRITDARQLAFYFCRKHTIHSLPLIGKHFGNKDHSTVLHGIRKIASRLTIYRSVIAEIEFVLAGYHK